jgi:DNA primase large subunit
VSTFVFLPTQETPSNDEVLEAVLEARRRDYLSHFVLRLAYCRSDSLRHWFVAQEADLFKFRLMRASAEDKRCFLKRCDLKCGEVVGDLNKRSASRRWSVFIFFFLYQVKCLLYAL